MIILPHLLKNLRKENNIKSFGNNLSAAMMILLCFLFFSHPTGPPFYIVYIAATPLYKKELEIQCARNRRKFSRTVKHSDHSIPKHQAVSMTCFCISSNYHVLRPSRDQRSVPDESRQVMLSWIIQEEIIWMSPEITEIPDTHSQHSKHKSNIFLRMSSKLFF